LGGADDVVGAAIVVVVDCALLDGLPAVEAASAVPVLAMRPRPTIAVKAAWSRWVEPVPGAPSVAVPPTPLDTGVRSPSRSPGT
jgi:hypothetical protein